MASTKLDGAGSAKMHVLEDAMAGMQRLHGLVEQMAMAIKRHENSAMFGLQIRRAASPLIGQLKPQFGMLADGVTAMVLVATRGGSEQVKLRSLRESVASLRQQLDIAANKVKEQHSVEIEISAD